MKYNHDVVIHQFCILLFYGTYLITK
jgi:hypothetical protein